MEPFTIKMEWNNRLSSHVMEKVAHSKSEGIRNCGGDFLIGAGICFVGMSFYYTKLLLTISLVMLIIGMIFTFFSRGFCRWYINTFSGKSLRKLDGVHEYEFQEDWIAVSIIAADSGEVKRKQLLISKCIGFSDEEDVVMVLGTEFEAETEMDRKKYKGKNAQSKVVIAIDKKQMNEDQIKRWNEYRKKCLMDVAEFSWKDY